MAFLVKLWTYLLSAMLQSKAMSEFNAIYFTLVNSWSESDCAQRLDNSIEIQTTIFELRKRYIETQCVSFKSFISACITITKEAVIEQIRAVIIRDITTVHCSNSITSRYLIFSFGGAALARTWSKFEHDKHGLYLKAVDRLREPNVCDDAIPERLRAENTGTMKLMTADLERCVSMALDQLDRDLSVVLRVALEPDLFVVINKIISRRDIKIEFDVLYAGYTIDTLIDKDILDLYYPNGLKLDTKDMLLDRIYIMFMKSALNKGCNKIIASKEYNKIFVPLRIQEKIKCMNSTDPFALN
eukprot:918615_1